MSICYQNSVFQEISDKFCRSLPADTGGNQRVYTYLEN